MKDAARFVLVTALMASALTAGAAEPVEGRDYQRVNPAVPTSDPAKVVVTQFFSYQCPHCYKFEKSFADWTRKLPADAKSERAAVSIGHATWQPAALAFYALTALKAVPGIDEPFFEAIHRERKPLADETAIADWVATQGIDRAKFLAAYRSFSVQLQAKRADGLSRTIQLPSVPTLLIDGRYLIPISDDGNFEDQLAIADTLIESVLRERAAD